jgi:hypothetical protein
MGFLLWDEARAGSWAGYGEGVDPALEDLEEGREGEGALVRSVISSIVLDTGRDRSGDRGSRGEGEPTVSPVFLLSGDRGRG